MDAALNQPSQPGEISSRTVHAGRLRSSTVTIGCSLADAGNGARASIFLRIEGVAGLRKSSHRGNTSTETRVSHKIPAAGMEEGDDGTPFQPKIDLFLNDIVA